MKTTPGEKHARKHEFRIQTKPEFEWTAADWIYYGMTRPELTYNEAVDLAQEKLGTRFLGSRVIPQQNMGERLSYAMEARRYWEARVPS